MKYFILLWAVFFSLQAWAADVVCEGSYTSQFKNDRPNKINGGVNKTGKNQYEGELTSDWKGKIMSYRGTMIGDLKNGEVKGDFRMAGNNRHFLFTAQANQSVMRGKIVEAKGDKEVGVGELELRTTDNSTPATPKSTTPGMGKLPTLKPLR
jgi:hypothetical protein